MQFLADAELEITIGKFRSHQKFIMASSLFTDCILGLDFLPNHRISLDFANRVPSGPTIWRIDTLDLLNDSENIYHSCPVHRLDYPATYTSYSIDQYQVVEDWELLGAVSKYDNSCSIEYPDTTSESTDIIKDFQDLSVPGVANVEPFPIRTRNAHPVKLPPRLIPQAYQHESIHRLRKS